MLRESAINREKAIARGDRFYVGDPCRNDGTTKRYTVGKTCFECECQKTVRRREEGRRITSERNYSIVKDRTPRKTKRFNWFSVNFEDHPNPYVPGEVYVKNLRKLPSYAFRESIP